MTPDPQQRPKRLKPLKDWTFRQVILVLLLVWVVGVLTLIGILQTLGFRGFPEPFATLFGIVWFCSITWFYLRWLRRQDF